MCVLACESIRIQSCVLVNFNQWINTGLRTKGRDGSTNVLTDKETPGCSFKGHVVAMASGH